MTTYILHGGGSGTTSEQNKQFFSEITDRLSIGASILCVYYARPVDDWDELFLRDRQFIAETKPEMSFHFEKASLDPSKFSDQLQRSAAIFIRGGETNILKEKLQNEEELKKLFEGKIIAGSSAGAYILSTYYHSNGKDIIQNGFGILPIKVFCHYRDQKKEKLVSLKNYKEDLPTYALHDQEYVIIETEN